MSARRWIARSSRLVYIVKVDYANPAFVKISFNFARFSPLKGAIGERLGPTSQPIIAIACLTTPGAVPIVRARRTGLKRRCASLQRSTIELTGQLVDEGADIARWLHRSGDVPERVARLDHIDRPADGSRRQPDGRGRGPAG